MQGSNGLSLSFISIIIIFPVFFKPKIFETSMKGRFTCTYSLCWSHTECIKKGDKAAAHLRIFKSPSNLLTTATIVITQNSKSSETLGNFWILSLRKPGEPSLPSWIRITKFQKSGCLAACYYSYSHFHGNCCCTDWKMG